MILSIKLMIKINWFKSDNPDQELKMMFCGVTEQQLCQLKYMSLLSMLQGYLQLPVIMFIFKSSKSKVLIEIIYLEYIPKRDNVSSFVYNKSYWNKLRYFFEQKIHFDSFRKCFSLIWWGNKWFTLRKTSS